MNRIETTRKFKVSPVGFLYFNIKPKCDHDGRFWMGYCYKCVQRYSKADFIGERAVFETDGLTISRLAGIYRDGRYIDAKYFKVIEEIK